MKRKEYITPLTQECQFETTAILNTSPTGRPDTSSLWEP